MKESISEDSVSERPNIDLKYGFATATNG